MARRKVWRMAPGETRDLGVSMATELDTAAVMTGETPEVTLWTLSGTTWTQATTGFTLSLEQVNTGAETAEDGETIAIGKGIFFRLVAPTTRGTYYVRSECTADDGTKPARPDDVLIVAGGGVPA